MNQTKVTILLPAYNGAHWIAKAIKSALRQTFTDFQLLVVNDCSIDNTEELLLQMIKEDTRITYLRNDTNLGLAKTLNAGIAVASGEYIARLDQDDEWIDPDKLKKQIAFLEKHPDYVIVGTGAIVVDEKGVEITRYLMPKTDSQIRRKILRMNCFIHTSVVFKKDAVKKLGGYRPEKMSEDHDMWLRLGRVGKFANMPEYSVRYLFASSGMNSQNRIARLKQNILFARENKDFYPNYIQAFVMGLAKLMFLPLFNLLPSKIKGFFLKIHKKF